MLRERYERLTAYLIEHSSFIRGQADRTLFIRKTGKHLLIAQIYVDDIVFSAILESLSYDFAFEMNISLK